MQTDVRPKTKLREFLDARGIKYVWVAEQLGITKTHFHQVMEGHRPLTSANAEKLAILFEVSSAAFLPEATE